MSMNDEAKPRTRPGLAERIIDGEALIVNAEGGEILVLNEVGAFVWTLLDGSRDVEAIVAAVLDEFDVDPATARADVQAFLLTLQERNALSA
jgi:hypothetical protein